MVVIPVKKAIKIPDGEHKGVIINVRYRHKPYYYADLVIESKINDEMLQLKAGLPCLITENSKLGQCLMRFGEKLVEGTGIDPDEVLIGKACKYRTFTETNEKGSFARIDVDSIRPDKEAQLNLTTKNNTGI